MANRSKSQWLNQAKNQYLPSPLPKLESSKQEREEELKDALRRQRNK